MFELVMVISGEKREVYIPVLKSMNKEDVYNYIEKHPELYDSDFKIFHLVREHGNG